MQKGGPENFGARKGGALKKNPTNFTPEKWVYMIFYGVDTYFPCQKGGPQKILRSKRGALKIFHAKIFLHQAPPLTSVCERSLTAKQNVLVWDR